MIFKNVNKFPQYNRDLFAPSMFWTGSPSFSCRVAAAKAAASLPA